MDGRIPQAEQFFVKQAEGDRAAGHVERGGVVADQGAADVNAAFFPEPGSQLLNKMQFH